MERPTQFKNIAIRPTPKKIAQPDGTYIEVKHNLFKWGFKMVDPNGWVHDNLPHANGCSITGWQGNEYGVFIRELKRSQGFLRYNVCPHVQGIPCPDGVKPCEGEDGRGGFKGDVCCEHMTKVINARKAKQDRESGEFARQFQTDQQKQTEATLNALNQLAEQNRVNSDAIAAVGFEGGGGAHRRKNSK